MLALLRLQSRIKALKLLDVDTFPPFAYFFVLLSLASLDMRISLLINPYVSVCTIHVAVFVKRSPPPHTQTLGEGRAVMRVGESRVPAVSGTACQALEWLTSLLFHIMPVKVMFL